jgi:hypothetical protein
MLTNDEKTILMIAASGQAMIPIGRWEKPTKALVERGYMAPRPHPGDPTGHFNNFITDAGRLAIEQAEKDDFKDLIEVGAEFQRAQHKLTSHAEKIAQDLVSIARESAELQADPPHKALEKWSRVILERALAVLTEGGGA